MPGSELPDEWIIRGNHHDGWVNGAADPLAGMVAGWRKPERSGNLRKKDISLSALLFIADGMEKNPHFGSTEWAEDHQQELKQKSRDLYKLGWERAGIYQCPGSHTLETFLMKSLNDVIDPQTGVSIKERTICKRGSECGQGGEGKN